jgi:hypothetical protein
MPEPITDLIPRFRVKHHFEFDIGDRVVIRGSSIEADVVGLMKDATGEQYCLVWWYNGTRCSAWVFGREIFAKAQER